MNDYEVTDQANKRLDKLGIFLLDKWSNHLAASFGNKGRLMTATDERRTRLASVLYCITAAEEFERIGRVVLARQLSTLEANKALHELKDLLAGLAGVLHTLTRRGTEQTDVQHVLSILAKIFRILVDLAETQTWYKDDTRRLVSLFGNEFFRLDVKRTINTFNTLRPRFEAVDKEETRKLQRDVENVKHFYDRKTRVNDGATHWQDVELE